MLKDKVYLSRYNQQTFDFSSQHVDMWLQCRQNELWPILKGFSSKTKKYLDKMGTHILFSLQLWPSTYNTKNIIKPINDFFTMGLLIGTSTA